MLPYDLALVQFASYSPQIVPGITSQAFLKRHGPHNLPAFLNANEVHRCFPILIELLI